MADVFLEEPHEYRRDGERIGAVGDVLEYSDLKTDYGMVRKDVLEKARLRGSHLHDYLHRRFVGEYGLEPADDIAPYVEAYERFEREGRPDILMAEEPLFHPNGTFAGTPDLVAYLGMDLVVIDVKTTYRLDERYVALQCAGYQILWQANSRARINYTAGLHLQKTGRYKLHPLKKLTTARATFEAALRNYHGEATEDDVATIERWREAA